MNKVNGGYLVTLAEIKDQKRAEKFASVMVVLLVLGLILAVSKDRIVDHLFKPKSPWSYGQEVLSQFREGDKEYVVLRYYGKSQLFEIPDGLPRETIECSDSWATERPPRAKTLILARRYLAIPTRRGMNSGDQERLRWVEVPIITTLKYRL